MNEPPSTADPVVRSATSVHVADPAKRATILVAVFGVIATIGSGAMTAYFTNIARKDEIRALQADLDARTESMQRTSGELDREKQRNAALESELASLRDERQRLDSSLAASEATAQRAS